MANGARAYGDQVAREVSGRAGGAFADTTALKALPESQRVDGMLAVVMTDVSLWVFSASSSASAGAAVLVPDAGSGRWLAAVATTGA